jgi:hypothetical protein
VASARRSREPRRAAPHGHYVASLMWRGRPPLAANDNRRWRLITRHRLLPLLGSIAVLASAIWAALT